ncbi:hypothetical protein K9M74_04155 [Candidatus Woesearchaeota archaeon]|nr:hypothetical protein [Candidatus Woesearchaeota archaeon]
MDILTYLFTVLLAFLGLLLGGLFSELIREKLHQVKHFLPFLQLLSIIISFLLLFAVFPLLIVIMLLFLTFVFIWMFWEKKDHNVLDYIFFALIFVMTSLVPVLHYYMTLILFIFGFFAGGLFYSLHTKPQKKKKGKKVKDVHPHVAHHRHSGKHYPHNVIMQELLLRYFFFIPLTLAAYLIAQVITFFF